MTITGRAIQFCGFWLSKRLFDLRFWVSPDDTAAIWSVQVYYIAQNAIIYILRHYLHLNLYLQFFLLLFYSIRRRWALVSPRYNILYYYSRLALDLQRDPAWPRVSSSRFRQIRYNMYFRRLVLHRESGRGIVGEEGCRFVRKYPVTLLMWPPPPLRRLFAIPHT